MKRLLPVLFWGLVSLPFLAGCASSTYQAESSAPDMALSNRSASELDAQLRARLNAIRENPSQASPELIRDLQSVLKTLRDRQSQAGTATAVQPARKPAPMTAVVAAPRPVAPVVSSAPVPSGASAIQPDALYASALLAEQQDKPLQAVALYRHASSLGHAPATKRLMEIYTEGMPGIARNYVAAVKFKNLALRQGAEIDEKYAQ